MHLSEWVKLKRVIIPMKNIKWYSYTIVRQILQQLKVYFSYKQAIFTRGYLSQKNENLWLHKRCTWMLMAALFIIANKWKQNKCPSVGEKLNCSTSLWWMKRLKDSSKFIYRFNAILIKVPAGFFFGRNWEVDSKIYLDTQMT